MLSTSWQAPQGPSPSSPPRLASSALLPPLRSSASLPLSSSCASDFKLCLAGLARTREIQAEHDAMVNSLRQVLRGRERSRSRSRSSPSVAAEPHRLHQPEDETREDSQDLRDFSQRVPSFLEKLFDGTAAVTEYFRVGVLDPLGSISESFRAYWRACDEGDTSPSPPRRESSLQHAPAYNIYPFAMGHAQRSSAQSSAGSQGDCRRRRRKESGPSKRHSPMRAAFDRTNALSQQLDELLKLQHEALLSIRQLMDTWQPPTSSSATTTRRRGAPTVELEEVLTRYADELSDLSGSTQHMLRCLEDELTALCDPNPYKEEQGGEQAPGSSAATVSSPLNRLRAQPATQMNALCSPIDSLSPPSTIKKPATASSAAAADRTSTARSTSRGRSLQPSRSSQRPPSRDGSASPPVRVDEAEDDDIAASLSMVVVSPPSEARRARSASRERRQVDPVAAFVSRPAPPLTPSSPNPRDPSEGPVAAGLPQQEEASRRQQLPSRERSEVGREGAERALMPELIGAVGELPSPHPSHRFPAAEEEREWRGGETLPRRFDSTGQQEEEAPSGSRGGRGASPTEECDRMEDEGGAEEEEASDSAEDVDVASVRSPRSPYADSPARLRVEESPPDDPPPQVTASLWQQDERLRGCGVTTGTPSSFAYQTHCSLCEEWDGTDRSDAAEMEEVAEGEHVSVLHNSRLPSSAGPEEEEEDAAGRSRAPTRTHPQGIHSASLPLPSRREERAVGEKDALIARLQKHADERSSPTTPRHDSSTASSSRASSSLPHRRVAAAMRWRPRPRGVHARGPQSGRGTASPSATSAPTFPSSTNTAISMASGTASAAASCSSTAAASASDGTVGAASDIRSRSTDVLPHSSGNGPAPPPSLSLPFVSAPAWLPEPLAAAPPYLSMPWAPHPHQQHWLWQQQQQHVQRQEENQARLLAELQAKVDFLKEELARLTGSTRVPERGRRQHLRGSASDREDADEEDEEESEKGRDEHTGSRDEGADVITLHRRKQQARQERRWRRLVEELEEETEAAQAQLEEEKSRTVRLQQENVRLKRHVAEMERSLSRQQAGDGEREDEAMSQQQHLAAMRRLLEHERRIGRSTSRGTPSSSSTATAASRLASSRTTSLQSREEDEEFAQGTSVHQAVDHAAAPRASPSPSLSPLQQKRRELLRRLQQSTASASPSPTQRASSEDGVADANAGAATTPPQFRFLASRSLPARGAKGSPSPSPSSPHLLASTLQDTTVVVSPMSDGMPRPQDREEEESPRGESVGPADGEEGGDTADTSKDFWINGSDHGDAETVAMSEAQRVISSARRLLAKVRLADKARTEGQHPQRRTSPLHLSPPPPLPTQVVASGTRATMQEELTPLAHANTPWHRRQGVQEAELLGLSPCEAVSYSTSKQPRPLSSSSSFFSSPTSLQRQHETQQQQQQRVDTHPHAHARRQHEGDTGDLSPSPAPSTAPPPARSAKLLFDPLRQAPPSQPPWDAPGMAAPSAPSRVDAGTSPIRPARVSRSGGLGEAREPRERTVTIVTPGHSPAKAAASAREPILMSHHVALSAPRPTNALARANGTHSGGAASGAPAEGSVPAAFPPTSPSARAHASGRPSLEALLTGLQHRYTALQEEGDDVAAKSRALADKKHDLARALAEAREQLLRDQARANSGATSALSASLPPPPPAEVKLHKRRALQLVLLMRKLQRAERVLAERGRETAEEQEELRDEMQRLAARFHV